MKDRKRVIGAAASAAAMFLISSAYAVDSTWVSTAAGTYDWTVPGNWSNGVPGVGNRADFQVGLAGNIGVTLPSNQVVGHLLLGGTGAPVTTDIGNANAGGGSLTFDNTGGANNTDGSANASITSGGVAGSVNVISAPLLLTSGTISSAANITNASTRNLSISNILVDYNTSTFSAATRTIQFNNGPGTTVTVGDITSVTTGAAPTAAITNVFQVGNANGTTLSLGTVILNGVISNGAPAGGFNVNTQVVLGQGGANNSNNIGTIIINGNNTYSGGARLFRANIVLGSNTAFGTGGMQYGGGAAAGAMGFNLISTDDARTIANTFTMQRNLTVMGDHSLTWTGTITQSNASNLFNFLPAGKTFNMTDLNTDNGTTARTFGFDGPGTTVINGVVRSNPTETGGGRLQKGGTGVVTLNGTNTYTGVTFAAGGLLQFNASTAYNSTGGLWAIEGGALGALDGSTAAGFLGKFATAGGNSNGALALDDSDAAVNLDFTGAGNMSNATTVGMSIGALPGGVTYTGTITPAAAGYRLGGGKGQLTLSNTNALTGANALTVVNDGTVVLAGSNNYSGVTTIKGNYIVSLQQQAAANTGTLVTTGVFVAPTLAVGSAAALGTAGDAASNLVISGGTLKSGGTGGTSTRLFTITPVGATLDSSGSAPINFSNTGAIVSADAPSITGTLTSGQGTVTLASDISQLTVGMTVTDSMGVVPVGTTITGFVPIVANSGGIFTGIEYRVRLSANATAAGAGDTLTFGAQNRTLSLTGSNGGDNAVAGVLGNSATGVLGVAKSGSGKWILGGNNTYTGGTAITAGTLSLGTGGAAGTGSVNVAAGAALAYEPGRAQAVKPTNVNLAAGAFLDLYDNDMVVDSAWLTKSQVETLVKTARNGGAWNMPGITSTTARNVSTTGLGVISGAEYNTVGGTGNFNGQPYVAGDTLVKYTWNGDANFDGRVTFDDYVKIDTGFNTGLTGWLNGDFNYSGAVTFDDYVLIDIAFNQQNGTLGRAIGWVSGDDRSESGRTATGVQEVIGHLEQFGGAYGAAFLAAVPEPTTLALLVVPAVAGMVRRRRRAN